MIDLRHVDISSKSLYHATYRAYLPSILCDGLIPSKNPCWGDILQSDCVFLSPDRDVAESFAETADVADDIYDSGVVVLRVDAYGLAKNRFFTDDNLLDDMPSVAYRGVVPSALISEC